MCSKCIKWRSVSGVCSYLRTLNLKFERFTLKHYSDLRGSLVPMEFREYIPWPVPRIYYCFNSKDVRGGHAHREENEFFICQRGEVGVRLHDGKAWHEFTMNGPLDAVRVDAMCWHEFHNFSTDAILLAASSINYDRSGYIEGFDEFLRLAA